MSTLEYAKEMRPEDLPDNTSRELAELFGVETAISFLENFGGCTIYVPKLDCTLSPYRNKKILEGFHEGQDIRHLARRYGVTQSYIYRLINDKKKARSKHRESGR